MEVPLRYALLNLPREKYVTQKARTLFQVPGTYARFAGCTRSFLFVPAFGLAQRLVGEYYTYQPAAFLEGKLRSFTAPCARAPYSRALSPVHF